MHQGGEQMFLSQNSDLHYRHMPTSATLAKEVIHLLTELHWLELHCPVHYHQHTPTDKISNNVLLSICPEQLYAGDVISKHECILLPGSACEAGVLLNNRLKGYTCHLTLRLFLQ